MNENCSIFLQCQPSKGMKTLFETMDSETPKLAGYGGACTTVNEPLAMTTNYFHMVQVFMNTIQFTNNSNNGNIMYNEVRNAFYI